MRKAIQTLTLFTAIVVTAVMGFVAYLNFEIPDRFYVSDAESFQLYPYRQITSTIPQNAEVQAGSARFLSRETELELLGLIPVKSTWLEEVEERYVVPCGTPFGLKMLTDGVVIVGINPVETYTGTVYPADEAGLQKGDVILTVNGTAVHSNKELTACVRESGGKPMQFRIRRGDSEQTAEVQAVKSVSDEQYRCGIWVRDSSAGIGTVTFYDPATGIFGGLGHAVCDVDTGEPMPLASGEVVPVFITGAEKGEPGEPGELQGSFVSSVPSGNLAINNETGIYGYLYHNPSRMEAVPLLFRQEIEEGPVQILATIQGDTPQYYDAEIEKVNLGDHTPTKNMILHITDPELLEATGGIVQGMSGSPILQDGKLAGAVTHVFVNDPTRGYGIFAENMLDNCENLEQKLAG
ncbi:MAG: SpoIVB peptidase [Candidatus Merdivicinus sp.]